MKKLCQSCQKKRDIKFFSSNLARICTDCKHKKIRKNHFESRSFLKKKLLKLVKKAIVKRDNSTCQRCMRKVEGGNRHVSHVHSVGAYPNMMFEEWNMKVLCYNCHFNWWHKEPFEAHEWFKNKFPERYEYLEKRKNEIGKKTIEELKLLIEEYK